MSISLVHQNLEAPVPMTRDEVFRLMLRLGHARGADPDGAEFLVHTLDLDMVQSILSQVHDHLAL